MAAVATSNSASPAPAPRGVGIGWRPEIAQTLASLNDLTWVEVIAESVSHGMPPALRELHERGVTVIPHGVRLGLGDAQGLDEERIAHFVRAARVTNAPLASEHIAFCRSGGTEVGHLTPLPRTREAVDVMVRNVRRVQAELPVPLALECIASIVNWPDDEMTEAQFVSEICERSDALLLLDVANVYANARNHGWDAEQTLAEMPLERLAYVHMAGGVYRNGYYHDTHGHDMNPEVVQLLSQLSEMTHIPAVMLERDSNYPPESTLLAELDAIADAAGLPRVTGATTNEVR